MAIQRKTKKTPQLGKRSLSNGTGRSKTIEDLAREQGVPLKFDFDQAFGIGSELWPTDKEFAEYLDWLKENRQPGR